MPRAEKTTKAVVIAWALLGGMLALLFVPVCTKAALLLPFFVLLSLGVALVPEPRVGHCRRCDYDLTGLTQPRCPECGTPFDRPQNRDPIPPTP